MKERLIKFLENTNELEGLDLTKLLSKPKVAEHGDFCIPMFVIAKKLGKNPAEIAKEFETKLKENLPEFLSDITAMGPFLNFKLNASMESKNILESINLNSKVFENINRANKAFENQRKIFENINRANKAFENQKKVFENINRANKAFENQKKVFENINRVNKAFENQKKVFENINVATKAFEEKIKAFEQINDIIKKINNHFKISEKEEVKILENTKKIESKNILENILNNNFQKSEKQEKILIEYPSPNTNKALHIGHVRNILLGNSLAKVLEFTGNTVVRTNLNNDRGIAICKAMLGFEKYKSNQTPETENVKSDQFVADCYVKFEAENKLNPELENEALAMLKKWEEGDKKTLDLWNKILGWVYNGYKVTYKRFKMPNFDKEYRESEIFDKGKDIVIKALNNNVKGFKKDPETEAVFVDFESKTLGEKYLLRKDGTTLYMTQDLYLATKKEKDFSADRNIFVVAHEQAYHFQVLFNILERLGLGGENKNFHFAYGMIYDKNGEKFSSRKGNALSADELYETIIAKAKENLNNKLEENNSSLPEEELTKRSEIIGYSALAFSMLKVNPLSDINFDIEKSLAMTGETGPYIQYTYARIKSILRKENYDFEKINYNNFKEKEVNLIKLLGEFNSYVKQASEKYKLSAIANYLIKLCQGFNEFYQNEKVIGADNQNEKLYLCDMTSKIIKQGLELLDIEILEEM